MKLTKKEIADKLEISHSAIVQWEDSGKIPAARCFQLEDIIGIPAKKLFENPHILFDKFNGSPAKSSRAKSPKNTPKDAA